MANPNPDLVTLFRARTTLLWIDTTEELRAERAGAKQALQAGYVPLYWDCDTGLTNADGTEEGSGTAASDPGAVLAEFRAMARRAVLFLRDFDAFVADPFIVRRLKSLARDLQAAPAGAERSIVILASGGQPVPPALGGGITTRVEWPRPSREEVGEILSTAVGGLSASLEAAIAAADGAEDTKRKELRQSQLLALLKSVGNGGREAAIDAAIGLTGEQISSCYAQCLTRDKVIDPESIRQDKAAIISGVEGLEWIEPNPRGFGDIGGLELLKGWLTELRPAFGQDAADYGLQPPKGVLLVGQPGCGKSHTAKSIGSAWGFPILRLDLGDAKSKWVGESEGNLATGLAVAESVSPCILWIDEVEKALGGSGGAEAGSVDTGFLSKLLTWLQERSGAVYLVATANDVTTLPPELLRKGRLDEIFFVDLPSRTERIAIATATISGGAVPRDPALYDLEAIADASPSYTGAEIAAAWEAAKRTAYRDGRREPTTADYVSALVSIVPASKTSAEAVALRRDWAKGKARAASIQTTSTPAATQVGRRNIDLG